MSYELEIYCSACRVQKLARGRKQWTDRSQCEGAGQTATVEGDEENPVSRELQVKEAVTQPLPQAAQE